MRLTIGMLEGMRRAITKYLSLTEDWDEKDFRESQKAEQWILEEIQRRLDRKAKS